MSLSDKQFIFTRNVAQLIQYIYSTGHYCTFGDAYRTYEQAALYAQQGKGIKDSLHCKRLAIDLNIFSPTKKYLSDTQDYEQFGLYWESLHHDNRWGGVFIKHDGNHFQMNE